MAVVSAETPPGPWATGSSSPSRNPLPGRGGGSVAVKRFLDQTPAALICKQLGPRPWYVRRRECAYGKCTWTVCMREVYVELALIILEIVSRYVKLCFGHLVM